MLARLGLCLGMLLACRYCPAGQWKPVAVVSFSGWANLQSDLDFLGQLAQLPALPETLGTALTARSGVERLDGVDLQRPWGALVQTDGLRMTPIAFVPVSDAGLLLRSLIPLAGEPREELPGVWKIGHQTLTGFVREANGWAFVAQTAEALQELPDPTAALGELPARYRLAVSLFPANVPEALRTLVIDEARDRRRLLLDGGNGEPPLLPAPLAALPYESIEEFFTDIRQLTLGCTLDAHQKRASLELSIVPLPESGAAKRWSQPRRAAGSPGAGEDRADISLELRGALPLPTTQYSVLSTQYCRAIMDRAEIASPSQRKQAIACADALGALLDDAAQADQPQAMLRVYGKSPPYTIVVAARLREAELVERRIRQLANAAAGQDALLRVTPAAARQGSLRVHTVEIVSDAVWQPLNKLLGNETTLYVATSGQQVLLACGHRALAALGKALPAAAAPSAANLEAELRLGAALAALARTTSEQDMVPLLTLLALGLQGGDDRLTFTADATKEGLRARLECREATLRAAAQALNLAAIRAGRGSAKQTDRSIGSH